MARADVASAVDPQVVDGRDRSSRLRARVAEACRFVGAGHDVRGVHIVPGRRPTFAELCEYQGYADVYRVRMSVGGTGMISVRPVAREDDS